MRWIGFAALAAVLGCMAVVVLAATDDDYLDAETDWFADFD